MKSTTAYYLIILYTLALFKPILPLLQDELAHSFWQSQHLSTVHSHHGDHHATEEMTEAAHNENNGKPAASIKSYEPLSVHLVDQNIDDTPKVLTTKKKFAIIYSNPPAVLICKLYPPPKDC